MNYVAVVILPMMILVIVIVAVKEKKDVYQLFIQGVIEGLKMVYTIFPYIFAITVLIGIFKDTGLVEKITIPFQNILIKFGIPSDIIPIIMLRPLSGSASTAMAMEIFENSGPDSKSGNIVSLLMGSTETTLYSMTLLYSAVKVKKTRGTLVAGLVADFVAISLSIIIVNKFF